MSASPAHSPGGDSDGAGHALASEKASLTGVGAEGAPPALKRSLGASGVALMAFFITCAGPFGVEPAVQAAGPLVVCITVIALPLVWALPQGLLVAELSCMEGLDVNGGRIVWVEQALGPLCGWLNGYISLVSTVIDLPVYAVMLGDYVSRYVAAVGAEAGHTDPGEAVQGLSFWSRVGVQLAATTLLCATNLLGIHMVERVAAILAVAVCVPFLVELFFVAGKDELDLGSSTSVAKVCSDPSIVGYEACTAHGDTLSDHVNWAKFSAVMIWAWLGFDQLGALAGEVKDPSRSFPLGITITAVANGLVYLVPVVVGAAVAGDFGVWDDGYLVNIGLKISSGLGVAVLVAAVASTMGLYSANLATYSRQLWAMGGGNADGRSENPMVPASLGCDTLWRKHNSPLTATLFFWASSSALTLLPFDRLVQIDTFLSVLCLLFEVVVFLHLRRAQPGRSRPYRVGGGAWGAVAVCLPQTIVCLATLATADGITWLISVALLVGMVAAYYARRAWGRSDRPWTWRLRGRRAGGAAPKLHSTHGHFVVADDLNPSADDYHVLVR